MSHARTASRLRTRVGAALSVLIAGWASFVLATGGSAEDRYFRTCTGFCEAELPGSYVYEHAAFQLMLIAIPAAIAAVVWWLTKPSKLD